MLSAGHQPAGGSPPEGVNEFEDAVDKTLGEAHLATAHDLPTMITRHAAALGAGAVVAYLVDLQQSILVPVLGDVTPVDTAPAPLAVDTTLAGLAFQRVKVLTLTTGDPGSSRVRVWLPLLDGINRLGVLGVDLPATTGSDDSGDLEDQVHSGALGVRLRRLAALVAELVMTKTLYGDTLVRLRRQAPLGLAAELQWSQLPPLTFACHDLVIAAALEPAYEVAGDAVDYAVDDGWARFAIFDGMGHGLQSAHLSVLAVAAYRNARRAGRTLVDTARAVATTLHLDPGHPFGMGLAAGDHQYTVGTTKLQPGDRLVLYTDGVTDARCPDGNPFGVDRLVDLLTRTDDPHLPPPETMRRVVRTLLEHQQDRLTDDATLLAVDWRRADQDQMLPS